MTDNASFNYLENNEKIQVVKKIREVLVSQRVSLMNRYRLYRDVRVLALHDALIPQLNSVNAELKRLGDLGRLAADESDLSAASKREIIGDLLQWKSAMSDSIKNHTTTAAEKHYSTTAIRRIDHILKLKAKP